MKEQKREMIKKADEKESFASLLLMGGKSRRMGRSKALLTLEGKTFFERITDEMKKEGPVYISVDLAEHVPSCPYHIIEDELQEYGPLGGILSSFRQIREDVIFLCACDMPFMTAEHIRYLKVLLQPEDEVLLVRAADGRIHMMGGLYRRSFLPALEQFVAEGNHRFRDLLKDLRVHILPEEELGDRMKVYRNVNTPEEYEALLHHVS